MNRYVTFLLITSLLIGFACGDRSSSAQEDRTMSDRNMPVRPPIFARQGWYDTDPDRLRNTIEMYLKHAKISSDLGRIIGLVSPHAGYRYSGPVAAYAYRQVQGKDYDTVVIIAPNHRDPLLSFSSVMTEGAYETPLGIVPVDTEMAKAIAGFDGSDNVRDSEMGHMPNALGEAEHSLEIQLPFLQVVLGDFKLVPIVMGDQSERSCGLLAKAIAAAVTDNNTLLVASTDLSHFYNAEQADALDGIVRDHVENYDPDGLLKDLAAKKCYACGGAPTAAVMMAARELGATKSTVLYMANSGDISGDMSSVVGYMAAAISSQDGSEGLGAEEEKVGVDLGLSEDEKLLLKEVVGTTLEAVVNGSAIPVFDKYNGHLGEPWGAFVTLTKNGRLRGCIGHIIGSQPLIKTVAEMTRAAALEDPRFDPVKPAELSSIEFEISVLTPIREITDVNEIEVGRDGIIITKGYHRGLLLPQVATEYGWDRETFLEQTCNKAGLPGNSWKDNDTKIEIFSAEIIH